MDLPDESQWDETTCDLAVCQHPQCWATIHRIERGHPRVLSLPCKTPLDANDKLPVLTVVNISDSCLLAKRRAHRHLSGLTFTKPHSLVSQCSTFDSKFQGRLQMALPDKDLLTHTNRPLKVPVLNLNKVQLSCPQDVRNKVVIWIPEASEKHVSPAEKKYIIPSQDGKKKRKTATVKDKLPLVPSGKQNAETQLRPPGITVPPSSPAHLFEPLSSEIIPFWNQFDMLPQDLLKDLWLDAGTTIPCPEMMTRLAVMKRKPPLEKSRPDSAFSSRLCLSVHRLTLQRPALRHPEYFKKLPVYYNLKTEGRRKWQQQRKMKTPTEKQEAKKKAKSDPGSQSAAHTRVGAMAHDPCYGHGTLPGWESDNKQQQQMKRKGPTLKQDSPERPQMDYAGNFLDSFPSKQNPKLLKREPPNKDISAQVEVAREAQARTPKNLPASSSRTNWNPEFKLRRILQATGFEDEESRPREMQRKEALEA